MKRQIHPTIKAHLLRSGFYALLLLAVCAIPFALGQRSTIKQSASAAAAPPSSVLSPKDAQAAMSANAFPVRPTWRPAPGSDPTGDGYTFSVTPGCADFVPGDVDTGNHCDDCSTIIALPFNYALYDQTFNSVAVGSNGHLTFGVVNNTFNPSCMPVATATYAVGPYWTDQCTGACFNVTCTDCGIFTSISGSAPDRSFNIEYRTAYYNSGGEGVPLNYEVRLYEGQTYFDVIYETVNTFSPPSARNLTVGVQQDTSSFTEVGCDPGGGQNPPVETCTSYRYTLAGATPTPTPTSTATPTATATSTATATATASVTPTVTPTITPSVTPSATPTVTPSVTPSATPTATPSASPTPSATPGGCVFGFGYWKNHPQAWPVTELQLGNVTYTQDELLSIMHEPVRGNGLISLAHHLITAKLNVANGADPSCIQQTIADADALIGDLVVPPVGDGYLAPRDVNALKDTLEDYNEGHLCAPSCDNEGSPTPAPTTTPARIPRRPLELPHHQRPPR